MFDLNMMKTTREILVKMVSKLSHEELLMIPPGFNNNIIWNIGHICAIQQLLMYKNSGIKVHMREDQLKLFVKGTSSKDWGEGVVDIEYLKSFLIESFVILESDLKLGLHPDGIISQFQPYNTLTGVHIPDIESCLSFNFFHEGLHTGYAMAQRRAIQNK